MTDHHLGASPHRISRRRKLAGFTLLELIVAVALIATASALATLALPDPNRAALEREGLRLAAQLEAARAQSRTSGLPVIWRAVPGGYRFDTLTRQGTISNPSVVSASALGRADITTLTPWLDSQIKVTDGAAPVLLGPEPIIPARTLTLVRGNQSLRLVTDGLRPFATRPRS